MIKWMWRHNYFLPTAFSAGSCITQVGLLIAGGPITGLIVALIGLAVVLAFTFVLADIKYYQHRIDTRQSRR